MHRAADTISIKKYTKAAVTPVSSTDFAAAKLHGRTMAGLLPNDLDAIIDLGEVTAIHRVMANFMQIRTPQVFLPAKVEVWASVDGKNFTLLGSDICSEEEAGKDVIFRDFGWIGTPTETRYVRFHAIQGKKQFLFTDEIVIQ